MRKVTTNYIKPKKVVNIFQNPPVTEEVVLANISSDIYTASSDISKTKTLLKLNDGH